MMFAAMSMGQIEKMRHNIVPVDFTLSTDGLVVVKKNIPQFILPRTGHCLQKFAGKDIAFFTQSTKYDIFQLLQAYRFIFFQ